MTATILWLLTAAVVAARGEVATPTVGFVRSGNDTIINSTHPEWS